MKTKYFLITTSEGEQIAVIGAETNEQFMEKLTLALREQMGDVRIKLYATSVEMFKTNDPVPFTYSGRDLEQGTVWARRFELY